MSNRVSKEITILDAVLCDSEADVEGALDLTERQADRISQVMASPGGRAVILFSTSTVTGTPAFTITGIEYTIDGTNFRTWRSFAPVDINAAGELVGPEITAPFPATATKIRYVMGGSAPDGSNKLVLTSKMRLERVA